MKKETSDKLISNANKATGIAAKGLAAAGSVQALGKSKGSILKQIKDNMFEFPVFISDSVPLNYATAVVANLEQSYAQFTQQALSITTLRTNDVLSGNFLGGLKSDVNDYLEYQDNSILRDSVHCEYTMEDGSIIEFHRVDVSDDVAKIINEYYDYELLSEFNHFFNEASVDERVRSSANPNTNGDNKRVDSRGEQMHGKNLYDEDGNAVILVNTGNGDDRITMLNSDATGAAAGFVRGIGGDSNVMQFNYRYANDNIEITKEFKTNYSKALNDAIDHYQTLYHNTDDYKHASDYQKHDADRLFDLCRGYVTSNKRDPGEAHALIDDLAEKNFKFDNTTHRSNGIDYGIGSGKNKFSIDDDPDLVSSILGIDKAKVTIGGHNTQYFDSMKKLREHMSHGYKTGEEERFSRDSHKMQLNRIGERNVEMLAEKDITKLNTGKPFFFNANIQVISDDAKSIEWVKTMISVKCFTRLVKGEVLPEVVEFPLKSQGKLMRKAQFRSGEINLFEYLFNIKSKKQGAADDLNDDRRWYKRLYNLAHMQNDALAAQQLRGEKMSLLKSIQTFWSRALMNGKHTRDSVKGTDIEALANMPISEHGLIPNCSLVMSNSDVVNIKQKTGIDILKTSAAKKLCAEMFLLTITVVDTDAESIKTYYADLNQPWDVQSLASVNRTLASIDTAGAKAQEAMKLLNR